MHQHIILTLGDSYYLVRLVDLVGVWISKTVVLVENDSFDNGRPALALQSFVKGNRQIPEGRHGMMRQTDPRLEKQANDIEGSGQIEVEHCEGGRQKNQRSRKGGEGVKGVRGF